MSLNNSKQNSSYVRKLYTGVTELKPVLINPSVQELNQKGIPAESVRDYVNVSLGDKTFTRIVIFLEGVGLTGEKVLTNAEFLISNRVRKSSKGKTQFKNKAGAFTWADSQDAISQEWFTKHGGIRPAFEGEEALLNFFIALGNLDTYSDEANVSFSDWAAIVSGNVQELKEYIFASEVFMKKDDLGNNLDTRSVKALLHVSKEKYMRVWTNAFDRMEAVVNSKIVKALDDYYKSMGKNIEGLPEDGSINLREFIPTITARPAGAVESEAKVSDLPF
jgi:hypothetical protein